jgi:hypothetical protein
LYLGCCSLGSVTWAAGENEEDHKRILKDGARENVENKMDRLNNE